MTVARIKFHPILGEIESKRQVKIIVDGKEYKANEGEMIAAALLANGIKIFRYTHTYDQPRGLFCGIGKCTDCTMMVNGVPNVRTCITPVEDGMTIETQHGFGKWERSDAYDV